VKNFALIGAGGFVAPRHLKAIKETGNELVAFLDPNDSVGVVDDYFPNAHFFTEYERFDRHVEKLRRQNHAGKVDYVSICSPNHLHDAHIRFTLRVGAHAICEKPVVLNPWNIEALSEIEKESETKVNTILQLRLHPAVMALKDDIKKQKPTIKQSVDLTYITSRGNWYLRSWKGNLEKSGGLATNIGIHFFDMLINIFGAVQNSTVHLNEPQRCAGVLELDNAMVRWFLSINANDLPENIKQKGQRTFRSIKIGDGEFDMSQGFTDLHTLSYREILAGNGFSLTDSLPAVTIAHQIRVAPVLGLKGNYHPILKNISLA